MTAGEAFKKIAYFCAYRERSINETIEKLESFELEPKVIDELIEKLKEEKYLNEIRFAESYAGGKFRVKNWGKIKIKMGLKSHGVSSQVINSALENITDPDYQNTLVHLFELKMKELKKISSAIDKQKMFNYLASKGFESEKILSLIHQNT